MAALPNQAMLSFAESHHPLAEAPTTTPEADPPPAGPAATSRRAAARIRPAAPSLLRKVREHIASRGPEGATGDEIEAAIGIKHQTLGPRLRELVKAGQVGDSGRVRKTRSGRDAVVWVATPAGA